MYNTEHAPKLSKIPLRAKTNGLFVQVKKDVKVLLFILYDFPTSFTSTLHQFIVLIYKRENKIKLGSPIKLPCGRKLNQ
jgi:hypothetical protein